MPRPIDPNPDEVDCPVNFIDEVNQSGINRPRLSCTIEEIEGEQVIVNEVCVGPEGSPEEICFTELQYPGPRKFYAMRGKSGDNIAPTSTISQESFDQAVQNAAEWGTLSDDPNVRMAIALGLHHPNIQNTLLNDPNEQVRMSVAAYAAQNDNEALQLQLLDDPSVEVREVLLTLTKSPSIINALRDDPNEGIQKHAIAISSDVERVQIPPHYRDLQEELLETRRGPEGYVLKPEYDPDIGMTEALLTKVGETFLRDLWKKIPLSTKEEFCGFPAETEQCYQEFQTDLLMEMSGSLRSRDYDMSAAEFADWITDFIEETRFTKRVDI